MHKRKAIIIYKSPILVRHKWVSHVQHQPWLIVTKKKKVKRVLSMKDRLNLSVSFCGWESLVLDGMLLSVILLQQWQKLIERQMFNLHLKLCFEEKEEKDKQIKSKAKMELYEETFKCRGYFLLERWKFPSVNQSKDESTQHI